MTTESDPEQSEQPSDHPPVAAVTVCVFTVAVAGWAIPFGGLALALLYALTGIRRSRIGMLLMFAIGVYFAFNALHVLTTETNELPIGHLPGT